ncbi:MAG: TrkH family potassium uptake protein [Ruminococcaceae bacterium]|nr:TrkH family potassium uptake protein [Oscillospiraceae bacterium]
MNKRMIVYMLGRLVSFEGILLLFPTLVAVIYKENTFLTYLCCALALILLGLLMSLIKIKDKTIFSKEGLVTVALGWVVLSLGGAVPFCLTGEIPSFIDAFFETVSGFTTTGSSILTDVEALSKSSIFWRSFTHWIGGMGVIVFVIATMKMAAGGGNIYLLRSESPGPEVSKLVPSSKGTAKILYIIYFVMTVIEIIALLFCGLSLFDSLTISFGTAGTGGFGISNSFTAANNPAAQTVIAIFMAAFGVNFSCYYLLLVKKFKDFFKNEELRAYLFIMLGSVLIVALNIAKMYESFGEALHHSFFQVSSIMTTTGYTTTDFNAWPELSRMIMLIVMFIGASAGSTGGGIKVIRVIILAKVGRREIQLATKPNKVSPIRCDGKPVSEAMVRSVCSYFAIYMIVFVISLLLISLEDKDIVSNTTSVIATLNNIGPGLEIVGATGNYSTYTNFSKLVLSADMLLGRLELLPLFVLFSPKTWKRR